MSEQTECNGWKNDETWAIATWIENNESLYLAAVEFMQTYKGQTPYGDFVRLEGLDSTPDGISFTSPILDLTELNEMMRDLGGR